ncbi:hypothetical protein [Raoultella ornithinolytica]|uniref:hypothetical protein n=1 Tax=Raoultella ornithinolytica TaxID=54291 RepID=UPI001EF7ABFE|nr:hypothetical protein [Raoultella ornithinolytica]
MGEYNTGNSVPSSAMPDAWDNNATIDEFANSHELTTITRTGIERDTMAGIQKKADDQREQMAIDGAAVVEATRQNLIPLSRQYMTLAAAQADIANIPVGSTTYYRSPDDSALAVEVINNGGTLEATGRKMPSQNGVDERWLQFMGVFNSMFRTTGIPEGWDVLALNKFGQYNGGIDSDGAWNLGKLITAIATLASADINNLTAGKITFAGGTTTSAQLPPGFVFAFLSDLMQAVAGIKADGTVSVGKLEAINAIIGAFVNDVSFKGGAKTSSILPPGFVWGVINEYAQSPLGVDSQGRTLAGEVVTKKLTADEIISPSLGQTKKPIVKYLTDMIHLIIFGQSLAEGINSMPLQTIVAILNAFRFNGGVRAQDGSGTSAENHASILPYIETMKDTGDGIGYETPMGGAITAVLDRLAVDAEGYSAGDLKVLGSAPGQGSKTIAQLRQNPGPYMQRVSDDMSFGLARANELGLTYSPHAVIWMQGESDQTAGTTIAQYIDAYGKMVDAINGFASTTTGKTEVLPWFTYQFNSWKNRTPNTSYPTIPLALLQLARTRDDTRLVQPMYMYDYYDAAHLLGFDSKMCGYRFGLAIEQEMLTGKKFEPLWSKDVILQGGIGNVFYNPVAGLALDTSLVTDPGNYGMSLVDPDDNPLTLTEVSVHLDRLRVRASGGIPAGSKLRIGFTGGTTGTLPSRTNGPRCCLRDNQGDTIKFDPNGIAYRMDNYAIVEEITLN